MKIIFKTYIVRIIVLSIFAISCSKNESGTEVTSETKTIIIEEKTSTQINLKISSFSKNFDFKNVQIWVTDKSIYTNDIPLLPTSTLEKINVSTDGKASLNTDKYIGKTLFFNVLRVESTGITLHPTPKVENNITTNKDTDSYSFVPEKNVEVSTTLLVR